MRSRVDQLDRVRGRRSYGEPRCELLLSATVNNVHFSMCVTYVADQQARAVMILLLFLRE